MDKCPYELYRLCILVLNSTSLPSSNSPSTWSFYIGVVLLNLSYFFLLVVHFIPNRSLEIFSCKKSDYSRRYYRYSICLLTQYASFVQFQDKMKAKFSNDRFGFIELIIMFLISQSYNNQHIKPIIKDKSVV